MLKVIVRQAFYILAVIDTNGTAVEGVNVTRRSSRLTYPVFFSLYLIPVQGGYGAVFAIMVQSYLSFLCVAVQGYQVTEE